MNYFAIIKDGYIVAVGKGRAGVDITEKEYENITAAVVAMPTAPDGYVYRLRANGLEWELIELPPMPEPSVEDKAEAYDILMGGAP